MPLKDEEAAHEVNAGERQTDLLEVEYDHSIPKA